MEASTATCHLSSQGLVLKKVYCSLLFCMIGWFLKGFVGLHLIVWLLFNQIGCFEWMKSCCEVCVNYSNFQYKSAQLRTCLRENIVLCRMNSINNIYLLSFKSGSKIWTNFPQYTKEHIMVVLFWSHLIPRQDFSGADPWQRWAAY